MMAIRFARAALTCGLLAVVGCDSGALAESSKQQQPTAVQSVPAAKPAAAKLAQTTEAAQATTPTRIVDSKPDTRQRHPGATPLDWPAPLKWFSYEEGLAEAKRTGKAMMALIYADWCPKCHLVPPLLVQPDFVKLASQFVLIRQDHEADAAWLRAIDAKQGTYLPRILFLKPDGSVNEALTSGNPRYPYFYALQTPQTLKDSMRHALNI